MGKSKDKNIVDDADKHVVDQDPLDESSTDHSPQETSVDIIQKLEDKCLRLNAEIDNMHKRHVIDIQKAHKFGLESFIGELLPVIDNLEQALKSFSGTSNSDREGIELTLKSFENVLDKFGIRPINPVDEKFDPQLHEAVSVIANKELADDDVMQVLQRGWEINERIIRPARVIVVKN